MIKLKPILTDEKNILDPGSFGIEAKYDAHVWLKGAIKNRKNLFKKDQQEILHQPFYASDVRREFIGKFGFAIPGIKAIKAIKNYSPHGVTEIGAGLGYWTYLLKQYGVDAVAVDLQNPLENSFFKNSQKSPHIWSNPVVANAADYLKTDDSKRSLLMIWPLNYVTKALASYSGNTIFMIGEWATGATDTGNLFDENQSEWEIIDQIEIPKFYDIYDLLTVHQRII